MTGLEEIAALAPVIAESADAGLVGGAAGGLGAAAAGTAAAGLGTGALAAGAAIPAGAAAVTTAATGGGVLGSGLSLQQLASIAQLVGTAGSLGTSVYGLATRPGMPDLSKFRMAGIDPNTARANAAVQGRAGGGGISPNFLENLGVKDVNDLRGAGVI